MGSSRPGLYLAPPNSDVYPTVINRVINALFQYFELRDRARQWLGSVKAVTKTVNREITTEQTLWNKLQDQQKELDELKHMLYTQRSPRVPTVRPNLKSSKDRVCWTCGQPGHLKRDCPTKDGNPAPVALSN